MLEYSLEVQAQQNIRIVSREKEFFWNKNMKVIDGGICAPRGVRAYGIKEKGQKYGLSIIEGKGTAAGLFTKNKIIAAPCIITEEHLGGGHLDGIIANSGCANAFTGDVGLKDARSMADMLAKKVGVSSKNIAVASTGVIGVPLDMDWIEGHIDEVYENLTADATGSMSAAKAIMTTDLVPKEVAVELDCGVRIGGIAKGSGMIEPNMGTMFAFIYTDADISAPQLKMHLKSAVDKSFNMIVVDGDTSTNDTVLITATGIGMAETVDADYSNVMREFQDGLDYVCQHLARAIARDGEGATRLIEVNVTGACSDADAKLAAKAVVRSPLVKTAIFGRDPNWGRVIAAVGYSKADVDGEKLTLSFANEDSELIVVDGGKVLTPDGAMLSDIMESAEVKINVDLHKDDGSATAWGCDFSYDYVRINAEYTT